jgi:DHA2 family multidrug resistance protein
VPSATGLSNFFRITGGGFAASIVTTMWDRREALHQTRLVELTTATNPTYAGALHRLGTLGFGPDQASAAILRQVVGEAYLLATTDLFRITGWACLAMIALVWMAKRPAPPQGPIAAD